MGSKKTNKEIKTVRVEKLHLSSTRKFPTTLLEELLGAKVLKNKTFKPILFLYLTEPEIIKVVDSMLKPVAEIIEGKRYLQYHIVRLVVIENNEPIDKEIVIKTWRA